MQILVPEVRRGQNKKRHVGKRWKDFEKRINESLKKSLPALKEATGRGLKTRKESIIGHWRKKNPCYALAEV